MSLDVAGAGRAGLDLFLLLLPQDPLCQQVVGGCDVVVLVGLQGPKTTQTRNMRHSVYYKTLEKTMETIIAEQW